MVPTPHLLDEPVDGATAGPETATVVVTNQGSRPVLVGSHFHSFEASTELRFERWKAYGMRLNIAPGTAVRFEPGRERTVELVRLDGALD